MSSEEDLGRVSCWEGHRPGWGRRGAVPEHGQSGPSLGAPLPGQRGHLTLTLGLLPPVSAAPSWGLCLRSDPQASAFPGSPARRDSPGKDPNKVRFPGISGTAAASGENTTKDNPPRQRRVIGR